MFKKLMQKYNLYIIVVPIIVLTLISSLLLVFPEQCNYFINNNLKGFIDNFSWYYLALGFITVSILVWLSISKYGNVRLGKLDKPRYSNFAWMSMIYTSTMAADLIYYSLHDWMNYYSQAGTLTNGTMDSAFELAITYPLFHFGPTPWAFYILPAVAYAYWMYVKNKSITKVSDAMFIKNRSMLKVIDLFTIMSVLIAASVTLTISVSLTPVCISDLFGIPMSNWLSILVILFIAVLYTIAILNRKGIERLATSNVIVYFVLLGIFLCNSNITFILDSIISGLGNLISNFIPMSLNVDPNRSMNGFVQDYTAFYWAYWVAWAVTVPIFIGKISEGRTIRNLIVGGMGSGILGGFTSFWIFGNYGLSQQLNGSADFIDMMNNGVPIGSIITSIFKTFPSFIPLVVMALIAIVMIMQNATTLDSIISVTSEASYTAESDKRNPSKFIKIFWSALFIILPIVFILNHNDLSTLQTLLIFIGLPMSLVLIRVVYIFLKSLIKDFK